MAYYDETPNDKRCEIDCLIENEEDEIECDNLALYPIHHAKLGITAMVCDEHYELAKRLRDGDKR